jgi:hypothetical protein
MDIIERRGRDNLTLKSIGAEFGLSITRVHDVIDNQMSDCQDFWWWVREGSYAQRIGMKISFDDLLTKVRTQLIEEDFQI